MDIPLAEIKLQQSTPLSKNDSRSADKNLPLALTHPFFGCSSLKAEINY